MYEHALNCYVAVDQLAVSRRAARSAEHLEAVRERKLQQTAQRQKLRALRRHQEACTTAV